jgi:hypothetical protein
MWPSMQYFTSICLEGLRKATKRSVEMVSVPVQIQTGHFQNTRKMCHCFARVNFLSLFWYVFAFLCTNYTNTVQWPFVWALQLPVAMNHWPWTHKLKLAVCLFSPSNSLGIKRQKKKWYDISTANCCLRPVKVIQKSYYPAFCECQVWQKCHR